MYDPVGNNRVVCNLCRHYCKILPGHWGICGVRKNIDGKLYTYVFENAIAAHVDPIEKKPLFHVHPGSLSFSIATAGCNFHCDFCQNADIAQITQRPFLSDINEPSIPGDYLSVGNAVEIAQKRGCRSIAYTYTEPTIFFEYAYEISKLASRHKILNLFISNGYMSPEAIDMIHPYLDAANVDLKGFHQDFYRKKIGAKLTGVLDSLKLMKEKGIWLEVTTLIVPAYNGDEANLRDIANFIRTELGIETPWHISRFFPHYKMSHIPPTPPGILKRAREIGYEEGLRYVYTGNLPGDDGENTFCYQCGKELIHRWGFQVSENNIKDGKCSNCGALIDGLGMDPQ